jgi:hypothetical protein
MKKMVLTFSLFRQRAIICSPLKIAISVALSSLDSRFVGAIEPPSCQAHSHPEAASLDRRGRVK